MGSPDVVTEVSRTVGRRVAVLMHRDGITQRRLTALKGGSVSALNQKIKGVRSVSLFELVWFAEYFDTSINYLVGDTDDQSPLQLPPRAAFELWPEEESVAAG